MLNCYSDIGVGKSKIFQLYEIFKSLYNRIRQISYSQATAVNGTNSYLLPWLHREACQSLKKENSELKCQAGLQGRLKFGYQERSLN